MLLNRIIRNLIIAVILLWVSPVWAAACFWVGGTATWDGSNFASWATGTGGAGVGCPSASAVPTSADTVTFDGASGGGTVTVNTTVNVSSLVTGAFTGTLDFSANDNNVNIGTVTQVVTGWNASGTGVRTVHMGDGVWTIDATTNLISNATVTNYTLNANASTIVVAARANSIRNIIGGAKTFNNLTLNAATNSKVVFNGNNTWATVTANAPIGITGTVGATNTITTLTVSGSSSSAPVSFDTTAIGTTSAFAITNGLSTSWATFRDIVFSGGAAAATNSLNFGNNSGITIAPPSGDASSGRIIGG